MDYEVKLALFTLTSYVFLGLNLMVCMISAFNLRFNVKKLEPYMGKQVIRHFALSLFVMPACYLWIYNKSFMNITDGEALFWCLWHSYNAWNGIRLNVDVCRITGSLCKEVADKVDKEISHIKSIFFKRETPHS